MRRYAEIVRDGRKVAGFSQQQAAVRIGISVPYLSQIESGARPPLEQSRTLVLAEMYRLTPVVLMAAAVRESWPMLVREFDDVLADMPERMPDQLCSGANIDADGAMRGFDD
jgi:transcriptional regulator with XRE-family HTH domain